MKDVEVTFPLDELLRLVKALQIADHHDVPTPADWRPGEPHNGNPRLRPGYLLLVARG